MTRGASWKNPFLGSLFLEYCFLKKGFASCLTRGWSWDSLDRYAFPFPWQLRDYAKYQHRWERMVGELGSRMGVWRDMGFWVGPGLGWWGMDSYFGPRWICRDHAWHPRRTFNNCCPRASLWPRDLARYLWGTFQGSMGWVRWSQWSFLGPNRTYKHWVGCPDGTWVTWRWFMDCLLFRPWWTHVLADTIGLFSPNASWEISTAWRKDPVLTREQGGHQRVLPECLASQWTAERFRVESARPRSHTNRSTDWGRTVEIPWSTICENLGRGHADLKVWYQARNQSRPHGPTLQHSRGWLWRNIWSMLGGMQHRVTSRQKFTLT